MSTNPPQPNKPHTVPALFTKREKYTIIGLSVFFILFSGLVHFVLGGTAEKMFPHFKEEATPPPHVVTVMRFKPPQKNTPPPLKLHVVHSQSQGGEGTPEAAYVPPKAGSGEGVPTTAPATPEPARTAPPETGPVKIEDSDFIHKVQPEYPEMAKEQNIQGTVIVLITIGPSGNVVTASIAESSGNAALDKAALEAAQQSTFRPPLANGIPTTRQYKIEYDFQLD